MTSERANRAPTQPEIGPLTGVRVLELGVLIAGPFAGRLLADMGAEVIKIEAPDKPDPLRQWGHATYKDHSLWWPVQSRNKKLITLDLRKKKGQDTMLELVKRSDVVLENFRPGTLENWNLGYDQLRQANRDIILARVSGYGQTGPYARRAGFASVAEAMGGTRYLNGFPDRPPPRFGWSLGDSLAAMFATQGVLAALYRRDARGSGGQVVDIALTEACFAMLESVVPEYDRVGKIRGPSGTGLENVAPSNIFESRDGKWIVIAANHNNVFRRLCDVMGCPELADDPRFATDQARGRHQEELEGIVAEWASRHDATDIDTLLNDVGVVSGPVYSIADIFEDPQYRARDMLVEHQDPEIGTYIGPGIVPKFCGSPGTVRWSAAWQMGAHNDEVYGDLLGFSRGAIDELKDEEVI